MIKAPFTPEQVTALNQQQRHGEFHPFTCGGDRGDAAHREYAAANGDRDLGLLVATENGWRCPVCGYTQGWAHGFMATPAPTPTGFAALIASKPDEE